MITKVTTLTATQRHRIMTIWLQGNLDAHPFVDPQYWHEMAPTVASQLDTATLYLATTSQQITGFAGLNGQDIAGIFVARDHRQRGVGSALITRLQADYPRLILHVYPQNQVALAFYQRHHFVAQKATRDAATGVPDLKMVWTPS